MFRRFSVLALALSLSITGCAPPAAYRRAALVPAPAGEMLTSPMEGASEFSATLVHTDVDENLLPLIGDPSLHVGATALAAQARFRTGQHTALGLEAGWTSLRWSEPDAFGTPPLPDSGASAWRLGPTLSLWQPTRNPHLGFTLAAALSAATLPYATWTRTVPYDPNEFGFDPNHHQLSDSGHKLLWLGRLSGTLNYRLSPALELDGGVSLQNHAINIGFDDMPREDSTLEATDVGVVPYLGLRLQATPRLFLQGQVYAPIGYKGLGEDATLGGQLSIGLNPRP